MGGMLAAAMLLAAALLAPVHPVAGTGHITPESMPADAVYTTGQPGSAVTFGRWRASNPGFGWAMDNYANPWGAGAFTWYPGHQTDGYLHVTPWGATLVGSAAASTVFVPLAQSGGFEVLGILVNGRPSSTEVLTDAGGRLVLAPEGSRGPSAGQWWSVTPP